MAAQFDFRHVFQVNIGTVGVLFQEDVAEFFGGFQLAFRRYGGGDLLAFHIGRAAECADRQLRILRPDGGADIAERQVVVFQFDGVHPDTHGTLRTEQAYVAHAVHALQFGNDVALRIVFQLFGGFGVGIQKHNHQEVRARFGHGNAVGLHHGGQLRGHFRQFVLHVHLRQIFVGVGREGERYAA